MKSLQLGRSGGSVARWSLLAAGVTLASVGWAAAPSEAEVQGLYEGSGRLAMVEFKVEARVVAQGKGTYKVLVRKFMGGDKIARVELVGQRSGDEVSFKGIVGNMDGQYAPGLIRGKLGPAEFFELKRVEKQSPTAGKQPPAGAIILLDGKNFSEMVRANGLPWRLDDMSKNGWIVWESRLSMIAKNEPAEWPAQDQVLPKNWTVSAERRRADVVLGVDEDGSIQVPPGGMNSKRAFEGSFDMHVEFMNPLMPTEHSQGRGNSGVYLPNGDEIQVLDSFGETTYVGGGCGGIYHYKDPDAMETVESLKGKPENQFSLVSFPPLTWQTYDIEYRVEMKDGKATGKPSVTVFHNGVKIHDNFVVNNAARKSNLQFQDHGNAVRYRNIWIKPLGQP